ncbi:MULTISPECIES: hypothetical protein, partial [unclassified Arcicella]|uniref:hypothetical protein n=1 Tax=unclassified Arcicella TaxID=2644986 RepID=UPI00286A0779
NLLFFVFVVIHKINKEVFIWQAIHKIRDDSCLQIKNSHSQYIMDNFYPKFGMTHVLRLGITQIIQTNA